MKSIEKELQLLPSIKTVNASFKIAIVVKRTKIENRKVQIGSINAQSGYEI
jgi:hypothetical protein